MASPGPALALPIAVSLAQEVPTQKGSSGAAVGSCLHPAAASASSPAAPVGLCSISKEDVIAYGGIPDDPLPPQRYPLYLVLQFGE